ncbi:MAG: hypothetical protein IIU14_00125 [Ruminococcus sp.]|nr:hypothetical protein [Ruminococcus sp.]
MANDQLELFTNKADFQNLINDIDGQISVLEGIATEYEGLKNNVSSFMEQEDDNFESMKNNVQENVQAVYEAIGAARNTKKNLESTLQEFDEFGRRTASTLEQGIETTKSAVKAAINASELGLI